MPATDIIIKGAREHNLRDVSVVLPRNQLICLTGVSGSGKSSLAFDTVFAEGQRRYIESLSTFARQFLGQLPKPDVDLIQGLSPSISISQKSTGHNPRSTVGTVTEIYDYLRLLYARVGQGFCPQCQQPITAQSREQILASILQLPEDSRFAILAPVIRAQKGEHRDLFNDLQKQGFSRVRVDRRTVALSEVPALDRQLRHTIEVVIDRLVMRPDIRSRLAEAVELALKIGEGALVVEQESPDGPQDLVYSSDYACTPCGLSFEPPTTQLFSFNSPQGMCSTCDGLGTTFSFVPNLLVTDASKSFKQGCIELIGNWKDMGRWQRHVFQGLADTLEKRQSLPKGTILETAWTKLAPELQHSLLYGTGNEKIDFVWRQGNEPANYRGFYPGIIPGFLENYRGSAAKAVRTKFEAYMAHAACSACEGQRLRPQARAVRLTTSAAQFADQPRCSLPEVCDLSIRDAVAFFASLQLDATSTVIAAEVLKEIRSRLGFLMNVGLDYLTLARAAPTLSGGETQRIRLASQIGSGLVGVLYILDEPSIGLHPRDNDRLLATLQHLRDMGNTVIVVEHDEDTMRAADRVIDFGPGPGVRGGEIVAHGSARDIAAEPKSLTGQYLSGRTRIEVPRQRRPIGTNFLEVRGASHNNLKNIDVRIPLGAFVCVTGVSGSGKSSLVSDILVEALRRDLNGGEGAPGNFASMHGLEHLDKLIDIDQSPIGRTPRSNPATYIKVFDEIRDLFTHLPEAKQRGFKPGRFSFNVSGGRCEACEGNGSNKLEMDFLADVWITCPVCEGRRFNRETLQVRFKDKSIHDVLEMDIPTAIELFENVPTIRHKLETLRSVGLDYLTLGQPSPTLSGGEAQRVKLARELVKRSTGKTLYLLDEPTTGLHFADIHLLLKVLHNFVDSGNTVLVVEHNLDVIKTADWVIDMGPEGGAGGGRIIMQGTPEELAACEQSYTGRSLKKHLRQQPIDITEPKTRGKKKAAGAAEPIAVPEQPPLSVRGARQHNLKNVDVTVARDRMTVFCGPSGSGKSSLAMDTIYAEGQRRYVESLSSYARQFVAQMQKPQLESIEGLSPAVAIEQKNLGHTPRSTVGTVTEIYDYLRVLLARLGTPYCPECQVPVGTQTVDQVTDTVLAMPAATRLYLLAPIQLDANQTYEQLWDELRSNGYVRVRIDGFTHALDNPPTIDRKTQHALEVVVDRVVVQPAQRSRLSDSIEKTLSLGKGLMHVAIANDKLAENRWETITHSQHLACRQCGRSFEPLTPHSFSFNTQLGWCKSCEGLGTQRGANPASLIRDPKLTLRQGALLLWPEVQKPISVAMLEAMEREIGIPLDVPLEVMPTRFRRIVLHGAGDQWFTVERPWAFKFQYKGMYPALEEASHTSLSLRYLLENLIVEVECTSCNGSRLRPDASAVRFHELTIEDFCRLPLGVLHKTISSWTLEPREAKVAGDLLREIQNRVSFLVDVGLDYLSLGRAAATLSNGEAQRIRLASQLGSGLCGVLYVLDEPTIGLHPRDNRRLLNALHKLRDLGNTLIVVEHDREVIEECDYLCDFGPGAGRRGGEIVAFGPPQTIPDSERSVTGPYLSGRKAICVPTNRRTSAPDALKNVLEIKNARHNNLRGIDVKIPLRTLTAITGPSGSGKSSLVEDVLYPALARLLHRSAVTPGSHDSIEGTKQLNKVIRVDQQPLGNSPTSNPATYTGLFELVRELYGNLPAARLRGYSARRFSFNVPGGRCEACEGNGQKRIEMHFLPDVWVPCETCQGKRYEPETLAVTYQNRSISDVLEMTCSEALELFQNIPKIRRILQTLCDVGLDYLTLGQSAPTLSGGEAQRVKLAAELARPDTGRTIYLLDEPTTGLHFDDVQRLLDVMHHLVDLGNTVVVIEHNLDVIKQCDWVIDLGPEAGVGGGQLVVQGTPEEVVVHAQAALERLQVDIPGAVDQTQMPAVKSAKSAKSAKTAKTTKGAKTAKSKLGSESTHSDETATTVAPAVNLLRSHTGEALAPVLKAGPYEPRKTKELVNDKRPGDLDVQEVGRNAKMPWEADGRRWHTRDRIGRNGDAIRWDGRILERLVDHIHEAGGFYDPDWNSRSLVEITGAGKSTNWFLHAETGEPWLLTLRFRVARETFRQEKLLQSIKLKPINELPDVPSYGNQSRVKVQLTRGQWQEVELRLYQLEEIDTPEFWGFVDAAMAGYKRVFQPKSPSAESPAAELPAAELRMSSGKSKKGGGVAKADGVKGTDKPKSDSGGAAEPWNLLGKPWHFLRRGFPANKPILWEQEVLEALCEKLSLIEPEGEFLWDSRDYVYYVSPIQEMPWAAIITKSPDSLRLILTGPPGCLDPQEFSRLGLTATLDNKHADYDLIFIDLMKMEQVQDEEFSRLLLEHFLNLA